MADPDRIALAVQQPWAELIVRGTKTIEVRTTRCRPGGRIYVYASRAFSTLPDAGEAAFSHRLDVESLPRGVVVGAIDLDGCRLAGASDAAAACVRPERLERRFAWLIANPEKFDRPLPISATPCGIWFYPFRSGGGN